MLDILYCVTLVGQYLGMPRLADTCEPEVVYSYILFCVTELRKPYVCYCSVDHCTLSILTPGILANMFSHVKDKP